MIGAQNGSPGIEMRDKVQRFFQYAAARQRFQRTEKIVIVPVKQSQQRKVGWRQSIDPAGGGGGMFIGTLPPCQSENSSDGKLHPGLMRLAA